ncbi:MAG TPA: hypothetical protein VHT91_32520 [Kofleriaceae bacterium]|nr:hypothetical protein [Kofleriaceae bacterium]
MRRWLVLGCVAACGGGGGGGDFLSDDHVIVDGLDATITDCRTGICQHNENTDLTVFGGATYLVHRTALSQVLGPNSSLRISRSDDHGKTWNLLAVVPALDGRDLRDPCFYVVDGKLAIKALTRLPVSSFRDSGVDTLAYGSISPDGGQTWPALAQIGPVTWSFWRIRDDAAEHGELPSSGDTSYAGVAPIDRDRVLVTWYSSPIVFDEPWSTAIFAATDIRQATIDLSRL